jgi:hypothetical protein
MVSIEEYPETYLVHLERKKEEGIENCCQRCQNNQVYLDDDVVNVYIRPASISLRFD